jgi:hypothetical protein
MTILDRLLGRRLLDLPHGSTVPTILSTLQLEGDGEQHGNETGTALEWYVEWTAPFEGWSELVVIAEVGEGIEVSHFVQAPAESFVESGASPEELATRAGIKEWKAHLKQVFNSAPTKGGSLECYSAEGRPSVAVGTYKQRGQSWSGPLHRLKTIIHISK